MLDCQKRIRRNSSFKIAIKKPKLLCIDRKNPRDLVRVLKEAKQRLSEDRVLAIFPEGTRSRMKNCLPKWC